VHWGQHPVELVLDLALGGLNDRFNRLRQSKIDEELSDVISGFKALSQNISQ